MTTLSPGYFNRIVYAPIHARDLRVCPLTPVDIFVSTLVSAVILPVIGVEKWGRSRAALGRPRQSSEAFGNGESKVKPVG